MHFWCKHSAAEVRSNTHKGEKDGSALTLHAARDMRVAGQVCLRHVEKPFTITGVSLDMPAACTDVTWTYRHVENVIYNDGVPYPDRLVIKDTVAVKMNVTHVIWVLFDVGERAVPGCFDIPVTVHTDLGDFQATLTLQIFAVTLPGPADEGAFGHEYFMNTLDYFPKEGAMKRKPCEPFYECNRYSPAWWELMTAFARTLKYLRVNSLYIAVMTLLSDSGSKKLPDGGWHLDFTLLDKYVEHFFKHGAFKYIAICAIIGAVNGKTIQSLNEQGGIEWIEIGTSEAEAWAEAFYGGIYRHFEEKGWLDLLLMRLQDEPHSKDYWLWAREKCRRYMPGVICGEPIDTHAVGRELAGACDQYIPRLEVYHAGMDFYNERREMGDEIWCYSCCFPQEPWWLNKFIDLPHRYSRLIKWGCFSQGITGFLHWGFNHWGISLYGLHPDARFKGDGFIVYPDAERNDLGLSARAIATVDGIQEYELLKMLSRYDPEAAKAISQRVIRSFRDFDMNEDTVNDARREVLEGLAAYMA